MGPTSRRALAAGAEAGEHRHRRLGPAASRITIVPPGGWAYINPLGHPCKGRSIPASLKHHIGRRREQAVPFFLLSPNSSRSTV